MASSTVSCSAWRRAQDSLRRKDETCRPFDDRCSGAVGPRDGPMHGRAWRHRRVQVDRADGGLHANRPVTGPPTTAMHSNIDLSPRRALIGLVRAYRLLLSPWMAASCRFEPSCSSYALQALEQHGAGAGTYLAARRVLRCNPFCAAGHDPVPPEPPSLFRRFAATPNVAEPSSSPSNPELTP